MQRGESTLRFLLVPIERFLSKPGVTEIVCHRPGDVGVEERGVWTWHSEPEMTFHRLNVIATLAAAMTGQDVGADQPMCSSMLPDGQRIQICRPPAVPQGTVSLTIRRPPDFVPTLEELAERGAFSNTIGTNGAAGIVDWVTFFREAVISRKTMILSGDTGSGKTTLAKALALEIPMYERIVTIEDTLELTMPHRNRVALTYSKGEQGIAKLSSKELMEAALRMRPDRVMMGEMRDGAAFTFIRSIAAGHPGSISTCHAKSADGAFTALKLMLKQDDAGKHVNDVDAMSMLRESVDVVAHCVKLPDGSRGVSEVYLRSVT